MYSVYVRRLQAVENKRSVWNRHLYTATQDCSVYGDGLVRTCCCPLRHRE